MKETLEQIRREALAALADAADAQALDALRVKYLGKKGELTAVLKQMGKLSAEERPVIGQLAHHGALLRGEFAHHFQQVGELTLLAQVLDPQLLQSGAVRSGGEGRQGLGADGF